MRLIDRLKGVTNCHYHHFRVHVALRSVDCSAAVAFEQVQREEPWHCLDDRPDIGDAADAFGEDVID